MIILRIENCANLSFDRR